MTLADFLASPRRIIHQSYGNSLLSITAPEYATGEVLLGSAYRKLLLGITDASVDLELIAGLPSQIPERFGTIDLWETLLLQTGGLVSPAKGGQKEATLLYQLMPLTPEIARYACVIGRRRNRWFPGNLLYQVIGAGFGPQKGTGLIRELGKALEIEENDDIIARFVNAGLANISDLPTDLPYHQDRLTENEARAYRGQLPDATFLCPAERFCRDIELLIPLKARLTRRQWTVMVEAVIRLGLGMHVLWICHINSLLWDYVLSCTETGEAPPVEQIKNDLWQSHANRTPLLQVGLDAVPSMRQLIKKYVHARFGLNLLLFRLAEVGREWTAPIGYSQADDISSPQSIELFLTHVIDARREIDQRNPSLWLRSKCAQIVDSNPGLLDIKSGYSRNMLEMVRYSLGQIVTQDLEQKSYDQSYLLVNKRVHRKGYSPWPVQPGPAMLIMLAYAACTSRAEIPTSLEDFRAHLADYGLHTPTGELSNGRVGSDLKQLGLLVDSPDAAGGRLVVAPF